MGKEKEYKIIFKVTVGVSSVGMYEKIIEIKAIECPKSFVAGSSRINKDKFMVLDSLFRPNHNFIRYSTYCTAGEQEKALEMLRNEVFKTVGRYKSEIDVVHNIVEDYKKDLLGTDKTI